MATFFDEDREPDQDESTYLSGPASSIGGAKNSGNATKNVGNGGANNTPSRFVDFERYFNANAGAANQMADKVANGVQTQAQGARGALDSEQSAFSEAVVQGTNRPKLVGGEQDSFIAVPGSYSGPREFTPTENTRSSVNNAYAALQNLRTPEGLQTSVAEFASKNPTNTFGNDRFNGFLTARAGQSRFNDLWNQYNNLGTAVGDSMSQGEQTIKNTEHALDQAYSALRPKAEEETRNAREYAAEQDRIGDTADEASGSHGRRTRNPKNRRNLLADP